MWIVRLLNIRRGCLIKCPKLHTADLIGSSAPPFPVRIPCEHGSGIPGDRTHGSEAYSTVEGIEKYPDASDGKMTLAKSLAALIDESSHVEEERKPKAQVDIKRSLVLRVKKRVKEQFVNGKFQGLLAKVIADPKTLRDAYDCIRVNSNIDLQSAAGDISFDSLAEEISNGSFDVNANTFCVSTKGIRKEVLILPNLRLKVIQEALRMVLEIVYKPHFSKISHGGRSGRGRSSALKYICKDISNPDWWFTVLVSKKLNAEVLDKLISAMEDKIDDHNLYGIIRSMFDAQVLNVEFGGFPKGHGLPQEGVLSPILMNIYLDLFDREFFRMSMRYEALGSQLDDNGPQSKLRSWFRRHLKGNTVTSMDVDKSAVRIHSCRFTDEIFFAVSGSKDVALTLKSEVESYLRDILHLDVFHDAHLIPCNGHHSIRFTGSLVKRNVRDSPALRAVHKLQEKVKLFALHKEQVWDAGKVRIGKKWLAHGLRKIKESEIKHLADNNSLLSRISFYRKAGMETDHWYKQLVKIWMQDVNAKAAKSEEVILSKYIAEPAFPAALRDSYYKFQNRVLEYTSSETTSLLALLPNCYSSGQCDTVTEVLAPVNVIKKQLFRYGLTNAEGHGRAVSVLILLDSSQIFDWFCGLVYRWLRWYDDCENYGEIKLIISEQVRKSCIRTLAVKYRMHESDVEKRFCSDLSRIPSTEDIENEVDEGTSGSCYDEALAYGISYSGLCLLSLARVVSESRPCRCFVMGCFVPAPCVYTIHVMERQKFPGWNTGFLSCIHPSLNRRRIGLCKKHLRDLFLGDISLQSVDFGAWQ